MNSKPKNSSGRKAFSSREQALHWLIAVIKKGRSVNDILGSSTENVLSASEISFAKQILFGSLRYFHQIKAILDQLVDKPLKQKDLDVFAILVIGIYQLRFLSVPDHAALSESVELTRKIKKNWASGLVNGILRNYQRQLDEIDKQLSHAKTYQYSHPNWIINQLEQDWPEHAGQILESNNHRAPMTIRVNQARIGITEYQQKLFENDINSKIHPIAVDAIELSTPCDVFKLPGFEIGLVTVQDAAAQLAVDLLDLPSLKDSKKILDGCAAPGGKTTHILQRLPNAALTSVEMSPNRLSKIQQTLNRMDMESEIYCADILDTDTWWNGDLFDRILIDVPCSASGVIRRNPDIKIHRKKQDLPKLVELQEKILSSCWNLLKPGGKLVYATCSIFKAENETQIDKFMATTPAELINFPEEMNQKFRALQAANLSEKRSGLQIFPGEQNMDGFFLCGLQKPAE